MRSKRARAPKNLIVMLLCICLLIASPFSLAADENPALHHPAQAFKVIGYYSGGLFNEPMEQLATDKLTHIIYAFLIPRMDATLVPLEKPEQLRQLIEQAHRDGAKVFIALGGWSYQNEALAPVFETVAASDELRPKLVENIRQFMQEYDLDGLELDWEHPNANTIADYEKLALDLKEILVQDGKEFTAALNGAWSATEGPEVSMVLTDKCLHSFDFINVMAYDMNNEDHSPLWFTETSIDYWLNRGVAPEDIAIGMPLYARPSWMQYRHLVEQNPDYAYQDYAATEPQASYYNGLNTLREKTMIALRKAGGVMLFDVNEDTQDETSVVGMIDELLTRTSQLSQTGLEQYTTVILDKRELVFQAEDGMGVPFIDENGRILMPLRKVMEAIGAQVDYTEDTRTVIIKRDDIVVLVPIEKFEITVQGEKVLSDSQAIIKDGRTYVPLRAVLSAFGYEADWHANSRTAYFYQNRNLLEQMIPPI